MLIVCPNCASSYGVDMARLRPAGGSARQVRCSRCRWVWRAELSPAEKLMVVADAVLPVRRAMLAAAQAAAEAARSTLPRLRRATTILAEELAAASARPDLAPNSAERVHRPPMASRLRATCSRLVEGIAAIATKVFNLFNQVFSQVLAGARRQAWHLSRLLAWRPSWQLPWDLSWDLSSWHLPRPSWLSWCPSLSRLHRFVLGLVLVDAAIIGCRADLVSIMPQTAAFYARLGLPVNLRGIDFDRLAVTTERHDGEPVLIVNVEAVPHLRFAIRDAQRQEIYSWTAAPARPRLGAGGRLAFRSEITLPPPDTREVVVRFVDPDNTL